MLKHSWAYLQRFTKRSSILHCQWEVKTSNFAPFGPSIQHVLSCPSPVSEITLHYISTTAVRPFQISCRNVDSLLRTPLDLMNKASVLTPVAGCDRAILLESQSPNCSTKPKLSCQSRPLIAKNKLHASHSC